MYRPIIAVAAALLTLSVVSTPAHAQEWRPSSREMPSMPRAEELSGDWLSSRSGWFSGVQSISGVAPSQLRAVGEGRGPTTQVVRFNNGPVPVVVWQDRNSDGRADIVEIYRGGGVIVQVIDADYDGQANVLRTYDSSGGLIREERL
jgi:hypothetical protein